MAASILNIARWWAGRQDPAGRADATLLFFQAVRTTPQWKAIYLAEAGCETGFERGHHGRAQLNAAIARTLQREMRAVNDPVGKVDVRDEFIESYQPFLPG